MRLQTEQFPKKNSWKHSLNCQVAVNHVVELTAEEKAEARRNAARRYEEEALRKLQKRTKTKPHKQENTTQLSLFDF